MKQYTNIRIFCLFLLTALLGSCIKEEQYPIEPAIEYAGFGTYRDVNGKDSLGVLAISYTDGDGDLGLYETDTVEPYKYNYFMRFQQLVNGQLVDVKPADTTTSFNARIPNLTPTGRNKNIRGIISMNIELYFARQALKSDTISFQVYIKDRALHQSNVVQSPMFIIKK